jgi:hypothetical protein
MVRQLPAEELWRATPNACPAGQGGGVFDPEDIAVMATAAFIECIFWTIVGFPEKASFYGRSLGR